MNILAIDTSTKNLSLAVSRDGRVLRSRNVKLARPLSSSIMPAIKGILKSARIRLEDIDGFAVGLGPGSFTSLRVGLATVKGLAFATGKPVVGVPSLDVLAMNANGAARICTVVDAKRKLVYSCVYDKSGATVRRRRDYALESINEVLKPLKGAVMFIGDGAQLYQDEIKSAKRVRPSFITGKDALPRARHMVPLAWARFKAGKIDDIDGLTPIYLYPEHCQINPAHAKKK